MVTGFDVNQYKTWRFAVANGHDIQTDITGRAQDPNLLLYNNGLNYWHWQYKALGSYELPWGLNSSATLRISKGEPYGRNVVSSGLSQGTLTLWVEPFSTFFYPTVKILDLRLAKSVRLSENWAKSKELSMSSTSTIHRPSSASTTSPAAMRLAPRLAACCRH
jgi:hypothetical protein